MNAAPKGKGADYSQFADKADATVLVLQQPVAVCAEGVTMAIAIDHAPQCASVCEVTTTCSQEEVIMIPIDAIPLPPGLRESQLTVEEAEKILEILDDPTYPARSGKVVAIGDASMFIKKREQ